LFFLRKHFDCSEVGIEHLEILLKTAQGAELVLKKSWDSVSWSALDKILSLVRADSTFSSAQRFSWAEFHFAGDDVSNTMSMTAVKHQQIITVRNKFGE
jgi:hypothetical protein